jgi:hypothetical protein
LPPRLRLFADDTLSRRRAEPQSCCGPLLFAEALNSVNVTLITFNRSDFAAPLRFYVSVI